MAYTIVPTITSGDLATATWGNTYIKNNFAAGVPDIFTADGEVVIGTGANAVEVVAILDSNNRLKHEYGGIEADISLATTGDTIVGQSSGVLGLETAMTQGQAQAGTDTQVRGVTAVRIKEAITALVDTVGVAKAWCSTTAAGALSSPDHNVASVDDDGTGIRTIHFTVDFSTAVYVATSAMLERGDFGAANFDSQAAGQIRLVIDNMHAGGELDKISSAAFFGAQ